MDPTKSKIKSEQQRSIYDDVQIDFEDLDNDTDSDTETLCPRDRTEEILDDVQILDDEFQDEEVIKNIEEVQRELNKKPAEKVSFSSPPTAQPATINVQPVQNRVPFITIRSNDDYFVRLYNEKLRRKEKKACENVRTFAETVKYRYPPSLAVIDANERNNNGFFFKNLPPQQIPIEKSFSGRWKFKLNKLVVIVAEVSKVKFAIGKPFEEVKEEDGIERDLPPQIQHVVKEFEKFLNENPVIQKEASRNPGVSKYQSKEFYELHLHSNFKLEIMTIVYGNKSVTSGMRDALKDWANSAGQRLKLESVHLRTPSEEKNKKFNTDHVYGQREILENVGELSFKISPATSFYSNITGVEIIYETLVKLIENFEYHSVVIVGSGLGLIPLLLAKDIGDVVGIEERKRTIQDAENIRKSNKIYNVRFVEFGDEKKVDMIFADIRNEKFFAIIDNNTICGRNSKLLERLHKMNLLKHIVVISAFNQPDVESLTRFFEPIDSEKILPFYPVKGCVVDPTPTSDHYQVVVLLERFEVEKPAIEKTQKAPRKCFHESAEKKLESKLDNKNRSNEEKRYRRSDPRRENWKRNLDGVEYVEPVDEEEEQYWSLEKRPRRNLIENVNILEDCLKKMQKTVTEEDKPGSLKYLKTAFDQLSSMKENIISISGSELRNDRKREIEVVTIE